MFKKILLILLLFFIFSNLSFAGEQQDYIKKDPNKKQAIIEVAKKLGISEEKVIKNIEDKIDGPITQAVYDSLKENNSVNDPTSLSSPDFVIDTGLFSPGGSTIKKDTAEKTVQSLLLTIIEKLIIVIGVLALAIMVIGAGFMIIYHGDDSLLTKGKNIFMGGIYGIVLALSAEIIVKFIAYLLY